MMGTFVVKRLTNEMQNPEKLFETQSLLKQLYKCFFQLRKNEKLIEENDKNKNDGKVCLLNL